MESKTIRNEADYLTVLAKIELLMDAESNTLEGDQLNALTTLVEAYEERRFANVSEENDETEPV